MGMLAQALQISTPMKSRHMYLHCSLLCSIYSLKANSSIKHEKEHQCFISSKAKLNFCYYKAVLHRVRSLSMDISRPRIRQTKWTQRRVPRERRRSLSSHLLWCIRHEPMVVRRCFAAGKNFTGKFVLASHFELPELTEKKLCFGRILTSHQFVLHFTFRLMYVRAFMIYATAYIICILWKVCLEYIDYLLHLGNPTMKWALEDLTYLLTHYSIRYK